jgi:hypothetical protein
MHNQRLANEFLLRLAKRATWIICPALRPEEQRDAFQEFHAAFKEELTWYEYERAKMLARLAGQQAPGRREVAESLEAECPQGEAPEALDGDRASKETRHGN